MAKIKEKGFQFTNTGAIRRLAKTQSRKKELKKEKNTTIKSTESSDKMARIKIFKQRKKVSRKR